MRVAGVDGVRGRWLAAVLDLDPAGARAPSVRWRLGTAEQVLALAGEDDVVGVGVDVPVGLLEQGRRAAETQARQRLGPAASSVFTTAPAAAFRVARDELDRHGTVSRGSRARADTASRRAGAGGVSTQSWMIAAKVLEVEDAVRGLGPAGRSVVEVHPETSFAVMAAHFGESALPAKASAPGAGRRLALLARTLPGLDVVAALAEVPAARTASDRVAVDDALDALAAACSALRHAYGQAEVLGDGAPAVWSDGTPAPGRAVIVV